MKTFFMILADSFVIWSRNLTLLYAVLLLPLLLNPLLPRTEQPALEARWILLGLVILLLVAAVTAGLLNMVGQACLRYLEQKNNKAPSPFEAFTLFGAFLPGIGRFFPQIALGGFIQLLFVALLGALLYPAWLKIQGGFSLPDIQAAIEFLLLLLVSFVCLAAFLLLTILWQPFVVLYDCNAFRAIGRSIRQFFRDPLRLLAICALAAGVEVALSLGIIISSAVDNKLLAAVFSFSSTLFQVYMLIVLFMYALHVTGRPAAQAPADEEAPIKGSPEA